MKPSSTSSLNSGFKLILDNEDHNFDAGMQVYETLSGAESDRYQYELPYFSYSTTFLSQLADGTFNFSSSGSNVLNNTNVLKTSINNDLSY